MIKKVLFALVMSLSLPAQEYAVVCNKILDDMSLMQVRAVFLKKLTHAKGLHLVPVNLPLDSRIRKSFEKHVLKMQKRRLQSYWVKQHYLGNRPPLVMKTEQSSLVFVRKVQGAMAYVKLQDVDDSVKVLHRWRDDD